MRISYKENKLFVILIFTSFVIVVGYLFVSKYRVAFNSNVDHVTDDYGTIEKLFDYIELYSLLDKVKFVQPIYGIDLPSKHNPKEPYIERSKTIEKYLKQNFKLNNYSILDVGMGSGFMSHYFQGRGAHVNGIDTEEKYVRISNLLAKINGLPETYKLGKLDYEYTKKIGYEDDVIFLLGPLRHVNNDYGLEVAQNIVKELIEKSPIIVVEVIDKQEKVPFQWKKNLPENVTDFFKKCDNCDTTKIGSFTNHITKSCRPLYLLTRNRITVNGEPYKIDSIASETLQGPNIKIKYRYYESGNFLVKENIKPTGTYWSSHDRYNTLKSLDFVFLPKLIDYEIAHKRDLVVMEKVVGEPIKNVIKDLNGKTDFKLVKAFINLLRDLKENKLVYKNMTIDDLIVNSGKLYLRDVDKIIVSNGSNKKDFERVLKILYQLNYRVSLDDVSPSENYNLEVLY
jgi:hypothetical protein